MIRLTILRGANAKLTPFLPGVKLPQNGTYNQHASLKLDFFAEMLYTIPGNEI